MPAIRTDVLVAPEAERALLALACDSTEGALRCIEEGVVHEMFQDPKHVAIWSAIAVLVQEGMPVGYPTVYERLRASGQDVVGGENMSAYLAGLAAAAGSVELIPGLVKILRDKLRLRMWRAFAVDLMSKVAEPDVDVDAFVADASRRVFELCEQGVVRSEVKLADALMKVGDEYVARFERGKKRKVGPQFGFNYLDNIVPGMAPGQLIVLAARPRTGKTAMMMQVAEHVAGHEKVPVCVFSLEMTATALAARELFQKAGADFTKFLNGFMPEEDRQKLINTWAWLAKLPVWIDESPRMAIEDLEVKARRMVRRHGVKVIFLDYVQLLYVRNRHRQWSKADELAEVSMRLKSLAKELGVPIFACAQMNREIEKETHRRPRLSDLRDTGQLEQDADVVMFLWRPDVSGKMWQRRVEDILARLEMVPESWRSLATWKRELAIVTCTVEKQREGRSGEDATLVFIRPWTRFVDPYRPGEAQERWDVESLDDSEQMEDLL